jgi:hypothetical protein
MGRGLQAQSARYITAGPTTGVNRAQSVERQLRDDLPSALRRYSMPRFYFAVHVGRTRPVRTTQQKPARTDTTANPGNAHPLRPGLTWNREGREQRQGTRVPVDLSTRGKGSEFIWSTALAKKPRRFRPGYKGLGLYKTPKPRSAKSKQDLVYMPCTGCGVTVHTLSSRVPRCSRCLAIAKRLSAVITERRKATVTTKGDTP